MLQAPPFLSGRRQELQSCSSSPSTWIYSAAPSWVQRRNLTRHGLIIMEQGWWLDRDLAVHNKIGEREIAERRHLTLSISKMSLCGHQQLRAGAPPLLRNHIPVPLKAAPVDESVNKPSVYKTSLLFKRDCQLLGRPGHGSTTSRGCHQSYHLFLCLRKRGETSEDSLSAVSFCTAWADAVSYG
jgi:hypothetical protein